jgi:hypothetical protein
LKRTLLDIVQTILSSMDGDEVNSINDTIEAQQVALCVRTVYEQMVVEGNLPENFHLFSLNASGDADKPTLMTLPATADNILWLKYNTITSGETDVNWQAVAFKNPTEFIRDMHLLKSSDDNVFSFTHGGVVYYGQNDKAPQFYTSIDDSTLIFDSYDSTVDNTLQASKTMAYGEKILSFTLDDDYTPPLDSNLFPRLLNEAKALAFAEVKQAVNAKAEKGAREGKIRMQRNKQNVPGHSSFYSTLPDYGRK